VIEEALRLFPFSHPIEFYEAPFASREQLNEVHLPEYVEAIFAIAPLQGKIQIDADTAMNPFSLNAALRAAGSVTLAVDLLMQNKAKVAFCNVRPPGHHAEQKAAMGFCIFNNVAVGVRHAFNQYHLKRIAIIDFDVHRGNGTQDIFQDDARVLYCSSFLHPFYPGYDDELDNAHILSVPLVSQTQSKEFREKVSAAWFAKLTAFKPEMIFLSSGFDGHQDDYLADMNLQDEDYVWLTEAIAKIAKAQGGKMIAVLEGGYNLSVLARCVPLHIEAMINV
jgi:acetoin utilization deacetylase AcuC-like enzyme